MPTLPSGLGFALSRHALIKPGEQWFRCPEGHFWYWDAAPEMGPPPYPPEDGVLQMPKHAPAPRTREEAASFIRVLELRSDGLLGWGGEWLATFPRYRVLSPEDEVAWREWLAQPKVDTFMDEMIEECAASARFAQGASGWAEFQADPGETPDPQA